MAWPVARQHLVFVVHKSQQVQQAGEQVEDGDVEGDRGHDVVGFAALDDLAGS